jgi:hypothetical protein
MHAQDLDDDDDSEDNDVPLVELRLRSSVKQHGADSRAPLHANSDDDSSQDITNILQGFTPGRYGYGYSQSDVVKIAKEAYLAGYLAAQHLPPPVVEPPKSGGKGEHADTRMCDVCGLRHLTATNQRRDEVQCWNKRNYLEYMGNPKLRATKDAFRKAAEANPDKYVPHKKQRVV